MNRPGRSARSSAKIPCRRFWQGPGCRVKIGSTNLFGKTNDDVRRAGRSPAMAGPGVDAGKHASGCANVLSVRMEPSSNDGTALDPEAFDGTAIGVHHPEHFLFGRLLAERKGLQDAGASLHQRLDEIDDAAAHLGIGDAGEGARQCKALGGREEIGHIGRRRVLGETGRGRSGRRALEEERNRHAQDIGNMLQPAGTNSIGALLVFLDLLEGNPEILSQLLLAHADHHASHTHSASDVLVNRIGRLLGYGRHRLPRSQVKEYSPLLQRAKRRPARGQSMECVPDRRSTFACIRAAHCKREGNRENYHQ